jgi:hypothetical protein
MELPFIDCRFRFRAEAAGWLPAFIGTTFRGAFGYELKATACHAPRSECETCLLRDSCVYRILFLGHPPPDRTMMRKYPAVPQPFVIRLPWRSGGAMPRGATVEVGWRLYGPAAQHFPVLVYTLIEIGRKGLGPARVPLALVEVADADGRSLYAEGRTSLGVPQRRVLTWPAEPRTLHPHVTLEFPTPMRLRFHERLCERFDPQGLLIGLLRRLQILGYFYGENHLDEDIVDAVHGAARAATVVSDRTHWVEIDRVSGRQKVRMQLGGFMGHVVADVPSGLARSLLEAGQVTHAGKATSFGFGRMEVRGA